MTLSFWIKRGTLSTYNDFLNSGSAASNFFYSGFSTSDTIELQCYTGSTQVARMSSAAVYRDPSSWYHIVYSIDMTQASSANGLRLYVNGVQQTVTISFYVQNANLYINTSSIIQYFGRASLSAGEYFDGYLTEVNFIDGQALTPSSFGSTNATTGVWQPARYTGTYGTNGFYLPFTDNSALTTSSNVGLGKDFSGNGNYWTTNNISITAGTTYDSMTDVPTLTSATAANFAVLNPLKNAGTVTNANLTYAATAFANQNVFVSMALPSTTKIYFETTFVTGTVSGVYAGIGIATQDISLSTELGTVTNSWAVESNQATDSINRDQGTATSYGGGTYFTTGDICMIAVDQASGKIWYGKNGTWFSSGNPSAGTNPAATDVSTTATLFPVSTIYGTSPVLAFNFGQRPFSYTPPTGFVALNTYNLPTSTILAGNKVMDATLYTGTLLSNAITNAAAFKPDLVWVKSRSAATDNKLTDSVRGVTKALISDTTGAETTDTQGLTAFNTNGFTVGTDTNYNNLSATYVAWQWQAGQGSTSSNTNGSITSTVSVNASAGFSVVTATTPASGNPFTVGHGLGVAPAFIISKSKSGTGNWSQYHASTGAGGYLTFTSGAFTTNTDTWNNTAPTSSVISSTTNWWGFSSSLVFYCWTPIAGYSAFGSYTGNDSNDGPFVYLGFRPKFVLFKTSSTTSTWMILDSSRDAYNVEQYGLAPNNSNAESTYSGIPQVDFLSNGFKIRANNANSYWNNSSGSTNIYAAFAENPFKNSLAR
jgi:hypothetical protein